MMFSMLEDLTSKIEMVVFPNVFEKFPDAFKENAIVVARGKIRYSALTGQSIPLGWARDPEGNPTQDANLALKGSLEAVGGVKGSGLSLIIDLVCGVLTNTILTGGVKTVTDMSGIAMTGHFFSALDVSKFIDLELFPLVWLEKHGNGDCGGVHSPLRFCGRNSLHPMRPRLVLHEAINVRPRDRNDVFFVSA